MSSVWKKCSLPGIAGRSCLRCNVQPARIILPKMDNLFPMMDKQLSFFYFHAKNDKKHQSLSTPLLWRSLIVDCVVYVLPQWSASQRWRPAYKHEGAIHYDKPKVCERFAKGKNHCDGMRKVCDDNRSTSLFRPINANASICFWS